jgi:hypothetical protein
MEPTAVGLPIPGENRAIHRVGLAVPACELGLDELP